jgi:hypothetical protein
MPSSFVDSRINQNLEVATEYFKALVSEGKKDATDKLKQSAGSIGFIPYNISFTMDGIGGIKIYNELSLDTSFLPAGYTNTTNFIVTGVDHKIANGDWETNVNVTLIPRTSPITNVITSSLKIFGQVETAPVTPPVASTVISGDFTDTDLWIYLAWQQGPGGAAEHYKVAKGTKPAYKLVTKSFFTGNWPSGKIASNGVSVQDVDSLYTSNPQKLAQAFIDIQKQNYAAKTSTAPSVIDSNGKNSAGLPYSTLKSAFAAAADPSNGIKYENLVNFAYIENSFQSDSQNSATYQGMFQMNKGYANYKAVLDKYNDGVGRSSSYTKYGITDTAGFIKAIVPLILSSYNSFKTASGYPN